MKSLKDILLPIISREPKYQLGICLSGGGALGFAHIGVLQALEDNNIFPQVISGASMGSIVGALYAAGYAPSQMLQFITDGKLYKITNLMTFQPAFWKAGLSNHTAIRKLIKELVPSNSFEKLERPLHVCVSNLTTAGWEIISRSNKLDIWIAASCSIPGVFNALKINNMLYVDGGLLNNMPAQPLKEKCSVIIGSDVIPHVSMNNFNTSHEILVSSIRVGQHQNSQEGRSLCNYLIEPLGIERHNEFSFDAYQDIYQEGYRTAVQYIAAHPDMLKLKQP